MLMPDIERAVAWAAREGWNPGAMDAACFAATDPEGFMGGWLGDRMIASISVVNYDPSFAFLGFYMVDPEFRGQGYGLALWQKAILHAGPRMIGLDGVVGEQENYRRSGFGLAYRNIRFGGVAPDAASLAAPDDIVITSLNRVTEQMRRCDRHAFPAARPAFLDAWIGAKGHHAVAAHRGDDLAGYGVIRPCETGFKIGPLFATDRGVAQALLQRLLARASVAPGSDQIFLDVPEPNKDALAMAQDVGLTPVFETARMYTGIAPDVALNRVFGVSSFELG
jgi:ribosomal protein S18 acetylase RimI-like enzyme